MILQRVGADVLSAESIAELTELHAATGAPVTCRPRWLATWFTCTAGWEPWLVGVRDRSGLVAAAVLARRRLGPVVAVVGAGHRASDESRFAARPGVERLLAEALSSALRGLGRPWALTVEQLPAGDPTTGALTGLCPVARLEPGDGLPRVDLTPAAPSRSSRNSRQAQTKALRLLSQAGHLEQRWAAGAAEVVSALPDLLRVHRERDLQVRGRSAHDDPAVLEFYRRVVTEHADAGEVELLTLRVDGDLAAYVLGFRDGAVLRVWDNRVAPRWAWASAGRLANGLALTRVAEDATLSTLDWMRGEEPYKLSSATRVDRTEHLLAWSSPPMQLPWVGRRAAKRALARGRSVRSAVRRPPAAPSGAC